MKLTLKLLTTLLLAPLATLHAADESKPAPNHTPSLPDADPRSDRFRCGGRESNFLAICVYGTQTPWSSQTND